VIKTDYFGNSLAPYYPGTKEQEAAKHVRLMAHRFVMGNANAREVDEACMAWMDARTEPKKGAA
jgi:hypothetical protein